MIFIIILLGVRANNRPTPPSHRIQKAPTTHQPTGGLDMGLETQMSPAPSFLYNFSSFYTTK